MDQEKNYQNKKRRRDEFEPTTSDEEKEIPDD